MGFWGEMNCFFLGVCFFRVNNVLLMRILIFFFRDIIKDDVLGLKIVNKKYRIDGYDIIYRFSYEFFRIFFF